MRNLLKPQWIFIINTMPILLMFWLWIVEYRVINTLLTDEHKNLWVLFGSILIVLTLLSLAYAIYASIKKRKVSVLYGIGSLIVFIPFIYLYGYFFESIVPFNIPRWMSSGNMFFYPGTFLMPTLIYALLILVHHFTQDVKKHNAGVNFAITIFIPIFWYGFTQLIIPLWKPLGYGFETHGILIVLITGTLLFLFFLSRTIFILTSKKANQWKKYELAWKIPLTILFPLLGLSINNGEISDKYVIDENGVFGDFKNEWFYILAITNGIVLCLPNLKNKVYRLVLFACRSITFAYTFYFFLTFLPFLPLSVLAVIALGLGFLMLTPLVLFVIHVQALFADYAYLKSWFSLSLLRGMIITGFFVIPIFITMDYRSDKRVLHQALDYIYHPDYSQNYTHSKKSLQRTLTVIKKQKGHTFGGIFGNSTPYLSSYYNWLVLDNLTLSESKIATIEKVFFDNSSRYIPPQRSRNENVIISDITTQTTFDPNQKTYTSWIDLELTNQTESNRFAEYATSFHLPTGAWISDYYLNVGDKKEMGILAEKKAAKWVYSNIVSENRDPGILYYLSGNRVAFKVFPFSRNEVRKTGIELIHKTPISLTIDGKTIHMGPTEEAQTQTIETKNAVFIPSSIKQGLAEVHRTPYLHFVVDLSPDSNTTQYEQLINTFIQRFPKIAQNGKITFVNTYVSTHSLNENWVDKMKREDLSGGYYLEHGMKKILYDHYQEKSANYPIIVAITDDMSSAILNKNLEDWSFTFPESNVFYHLDQNGILNQHSLVSTPKVSVRDSIDLEFHHSVLMYKDKNGTDHYLRPDTTGSILLKNVNPLLDEKEVELKKWESAFSMTALWMSYTLNPHKGEEEWLNLVQASFKSKIMNPLTSYLVVENEAQKAILKQKQEQVLSGKKSLDAGEDLQQMSEPNLLLMGIVLCIILWFVRRKKKFEYK